MHRSAAKCVEFPPELLSVVRQFARARVLLVGDMVADHYLYGRTSRISREAPVLILKHQDEYVVPGQAANTASNIATMGGRVSAIGIIGRDLMGAALKKALRARGVNTSTLLDLPHYKTLAKTRILAGGHHTCRQQVIRIDDDERSIPDAATHKSIIAAMRAAAPTAQALVVSDYGYGLVSGEVWDAAVALKKQHRIPLVLDSRYRLLELKGASVITPNEGEALACLGLGPYDPYDIDDVGKRLLSKLKADSLLVTRGNQGMALFQRSRKACHIEIFGTDEVTDVTGAGDTVVAAVSLSLAAGATVQQAAQIANVAGGIVVMKMGTATVSTSELTEALETGQPPLIHR